MSHELWSDVDRYLADHLAPEAEDLNWLLAANRQAGLPEIDVSPLQGKLLQVLVSAARSKRALEIGTLGGYSSVWIARGLTPDGQLVTLECEALHAETAAQNFVRAGCSQQIEIRLGLAQDILQKMIDRDEAKFDFAFVDADKTAYADYFLKVVPLLQPGAIAVFDNVVRKGEVIDSASEDPYVQGVREFHKLVLQSDQVIATGMQTVGSKGHDGLTIVKKL